jgi:hypothetical protein
MEQNEIAQTETPISYKGKRGGYRHNAGRKKGRKDSVSIHSLLTELGKQTGGRDYEEILVEDFLSARNAGDRPAVLKYHHLILNKVMNTLAKIEVTDSAEAVAAKQVAFAEALSKLTGINQEINPDELDELDEEDAE